MTLQTTMDGQAALAFFNVERTHIEATVFKKLYPDKVWDKLIPVDTSVDPLAKTVTYKSSDWTGAAKFGVNIAADDVPTVELNQSKGEVPIYEGQVGYRYDWLEMEYARKHGQRVDADKAIAARSAYENTMEDIALSGFKIGTTTIFSGFLNFPGVTIVAAPNGAAASPLWSSKTPDEILKDVNALLLGVHTSSNTVEMANTLALPAESFGDIASRRLGDTGQTVLEFLERANVYTAMTGQKLTIVQLRQLSTAGAGGTRRAIAYKKDPDVLRIHLPMPLRFFPAQPEHLRFLVPGLFRSGGLNVRRTGAMRYLDGI